MIRIMLTGALGHDCEMREVGKRKVINFNVGVNQDYKNSDGKKVEKTEWVKAVIWRNGDQSTKITNFLKKGQKVYIEGTPTSEGYSSKDGEVKSSLVVNVKELEFIGQKSEK